MRVQRSLCGRAGVLHAVGRALSAWVLAWWICGYMMVPLVALSLIAKRINQVGRIAVTARDLSGHAPLPRRWQHRPPRRTTSPGLASVPGQGARTPTPRRRERTSS